MRKSQKESTNKSKKYFRFFCVLAILHYLCRLMKRTTIFIGCLLAGLLFCSQATSAQKREQFEFYKNMPVYADSLIADMTYPLAWGTSGIQDFNEWRAAARAKVLECMMTPPPAASDYDMRVIAEEQRDGYKAQKIEFRLSKYYSVRALLLIPDSKGKHPAINLLHDHGAHLFIGKEKMIRPFADDSLVIRDAEAWAENLYDGHFWGDDLAREGYVVFSADAPMWGERGRKEGVDRQKYDVVAGNMMMYGRSLSAFMTYDDIATTDFLATLPFVDASRIGCAGCSMGGYRAWMLAALSDKIRMGACVCWMVTSDVQLTTRYGRGENGGFANCIPALRQYLDYPHIASIACPKPMLFIHATKDKLFPMPGVEKAFGIMHQVWDSQKAGSSLETDYIDAPHSCPLEAQQKVLKFLKKHL